MKILAIETSCDETAIAIADFSGTKKQPRVAVFSSIISSQVALHARFGGVVPNLAKREHQKNLVPILVAALKESGLLYPKPNIKSSKQIPDSKFQILNSIFEREPELLEKFKKYIVPLKKPEIDAIAVTNGPGLAPALWVGVNFAKALAALWNIPLIPVNHMEGHLYSSLLQANLNTITNAKLQMPNNSALRILNLAFPALALLVSGGHTELVVMKGYGKYKIIGETLDDASGEAFDKVARLLKLGYPGGPAISALAEKFKVKNLKLKITLPRPMLNSKDYNFSFSGLKTAVLYFLRDHSDVAKSKMGKAAVAKEFQDAVVDVLVQKTIRAAKEYKVKTILLGGGVAANKRLREEFKDRLAKELPKVIFRMPEVTLTGDNALMIALAAYFLGKKKAWNHVHADANLRLG